MILTTSYSQEFNLPQFLRNKINTKTLMAIIFLWGHSRFSLYHCTLSGVHSCDNNDEIIYGVARASVMLWMLLLWFLHKVVNLSFTASKIWSYRLLWKTTTVFTTILPNFTDISPEGKSTKFTVSFAFWAPFDAIKYRKTLKFSLERGQITWAFLHSARAIVKL